MCISKNRRHSSRFGELKFSSIDKKSLYFTSRVDSLSLTRSLSCSKQTPTIIFLLHHCRYHYHRNAASTFISQAAQLLPLLIFFFPFTSTRTKATAVSLYKLYMCWWSLPDTPQPTPLLSRAWDESARKYTSENTLRGKKKKTKGGYTTAATVTQ